VAQAPRIRYAKCGDIDFVYQVFGEGPVDLLLLSGPSIPIDSIDAEPALYRFYRRLASFSRVIRFDFRGMGVSSHIPRGAAVLDGARHRHGLAAHCRPRRA
jgi:pimeloyl-ACP methyl ester carboxylesterase